MSFDNGHLKIYLGSMFSGKSTELLREINKYKSINKKVLCINHSFEIGKCTRKLFDTVVLRIKLEVASSTKHRQYVEEMSTKNILIFCTVCLVTMYVEYAL